MTAVPPASDDSYKLAALQALASGGTAAKAALDKTKADLEASRTAATKMALGEAARYGLDQRGQDAVTNPINTAYGAASGVLDRVSAPSFSRFDSIAAPTGAVFDTKRALNEQRAAARSGGGGGGGGRTSKAAPAWQDEFGSQANLVYALKQSDPGAKFGDYRQAYQTAVAKGVDPLTAQRLFKNSTTANDLITRIRDAAQQGIPANAVRADLNQLYQQGLIPQGSVTYYTQEYRQATQQPSKYQPRRGK